MQLSKLTFSLASLVVLFAFLVTPTMAHDVVDDVEGTPATIGIQHVAGTTLTAAEHAAQHVDAPTIESIELVDIMARPVGSTDTADDTSSTVSGSNALLVEDVTVDPPILVNLGAATGTGQFQIKITFSEPVYTAITPGTATAGGDLASTAVVVTAASRATPSTDLVGNDVTVGDPARATDDAETTDVDESLNTFLITVTVARAAIGDTSADPVDLGKLPVDVWVNVNANVLYSLNRLVDGTLTYGTRNTASTREMFTVVPTPPTAVTAMADSPVSGGTEIVVTLAAVSTDDTIPTTLAATDFTAMEGTTALTFADGAWDGDENTLTIAAPAGTAGTDSTVTIALSAAGKTKVSSTDLPISVDVDRTAPTVEFGTLPTGSMVGQVVSVPITISGAATGEELESADVTASTNVDVTVASGAATFTPTAAGPVTLTVVADAVVDDAENGNAAVTSDAITVAVVPVTAAVSADAVNGSTPIVVTLSATAPNMVPGSLMASDFDVMEGDTALTPVWDGTASTLTITPAGTGDTTVTVKLSDDGKTKVSGIEDDAISVMVDRTGPSVTFGNPTPPAPEVDGEVTVIVSVDGTAGSTDIALTEISVTQTAAGATSILAHSYNATSGAVTFTPDAVGTVTVTVAANAVMDAYDNGNAEAMSSAITVVAATSVVVSVTATPSATTVGGNDNIVVRLSAAAPVLAIGDFDVMGGTGVWNDTAKTLTITPDSTATTVTVDPSTAGAAIISFAQVSVTVDRTGPTVSMSGTTPASPMVGDRVTFTISSDATQGAITYGDITVLQVDSTGAQSALFKTYEAGTGIVTVTPTAEGGVTVTVPANTVMDAYGNGNTAFTGGFFVNAAREVVPVTATAEAATVDGSTDIVVALNATAPATVPDDLTASDFSVMEGTTALTPSVRTSTQAGVVSADIIIESTKLTGTGNTTVTVAPSTAGMAKISFAQVSVMVDRSGPPVLTSTVGVPDATTGAIVVTLAFNKALKAAPDVAHGASASVANTYTTTAPADDGDATTTNTYTMMITPAAADTADIPAGTVTLTVSATDAADNTITANIVVTLAARTVADTTAPALNPAVHTSADGVITVTLAYNEALQGMPTVTHTASTGIEDTYTVSDVADDGDATTTNTYTFTVTPSAATTADIPEGTVTLSISATDTEGNTSAPTGITVTLEARKVPPKNEIAAGDYRVIVGPGFSAATLPGVTTVEEDDFPDDLAAYLVAGGTINVEATGGDVIISEFMVARDANKIGAGDPADGQWIELYNKHATDAATGIKVTFNQSKPAVSPAGYADRFTNVAGQGWSFLNKFSASVLNGSSNATARVNFVSIRRTDAGKDGSDPNAWGEAVGGLLFATGRVGTPGEQNTVDVFTPVPNDRPKLTDTVIISEVANRMDDSKEWIELKGPAGKSLKNWRLNIVTGIGQESTIFAFPNNDNVRISPNGYLLLTDVDPLNGELAADYENNIPTPKRYKNAVVTLGALPNNGDFLLVLRHRHDKNGTHEAIEDIAGYAGAAVQRANPYTTLWPLRGNAGVISSHNKLAGGKVYRRVRANVHGYSATAGNKLHESAFGAVGFTGLGYDRNAAVTAENGGTPGYPHSAFKHNGADAPGNVVISEIMYAISNGGTARNRSLSQWIEIHNMSDDTSVRLDDWRLEIVNSAYTEAGELYNGKLTEHIGLSGTIPPNQTYLIVARRLGVSQNTRLPLERVRNVGKKFGEDLLNPNGFYLTLRANVDRPAGEHVVVDTVGNLAVTPATRRADSRSYSPPDWNLSDLGAALAEDGSRISIARRTSAKLNAKGTDRAAWILSSEDPRYSGLIQLTWYGRSDDHATPGYTIGGALPVSLSKFRPERLDDGTIVVRWITESETNNAGFNILRSDAKDGEFTKLNTKLIAGQGTTSERTAYEFTDTSAKPNVIYYYQIQDVSFDGEVTTLRTTHLRGNVTPAGKLTTTWGELKSQD